MVSLTPLGVQFNYLLHYMYFSNLKLITCIWLSVPKIQDVETCCALSDGIFNISHSSNVSRRPK